MPWCGVGAKVHPRMYADMERVAALHNIGLSDIIRDGVALYLQAYGIDQGLRIEAEALEAAQARLAEHEAKVASIKPKVPLGAVAARRAEAPAYRDAKLREAARLHPEETATAVRLWRQDHTRRIIVDAVATEALTPKELRHLAGPPILRPLRAVFGSYASLRDAIAIETGVEASA